MKILFGSSAYFMISCLVFSFVQGSPSTVKFTAPTLHDSTVEKSLFESDEVLDITLTGSIRDLLLDRGEPSQYHPIYVGYKGQDSNEVTIRAQAKTRGHFRKLKENCDYPPIQLDFDKSDTLSASIFREQNKMKLVMPCQGDDYVKREWLVYKLYNLVTPKSFRARLVRVKMIDSKSKKVNGPFYGILLEEEKQMAKRNGLVSVDRKLIPEQAEPQSYLNMTVFQYLIGNTDWSIQYLQNIKLLAADSMGIAITVPYDFDHAGIVSAPYAKPAEELLMSSVRQRRYRGYCMPDMNQFSESIALFNRLKNDIYATYTNCTVCDPKYVKATVKFLDEFYATINNPATVKREFLYPCDKNGTGNVIIKGLRE